MDEGNAKETATTYTVLSTRLAIPPEWNWLRNFSEVASLLGKYRGQLSSVDEFIHNKQADHHEFDAVEATGAVQFYWIR
jgi:hypothetical protein